MHCGQPVTEMTRTLLLVLVTGLTLHGQDNGFTLARGSSSGERRCLGYRQ